MFKASHGRVTRGASSRLAQLKTRRRIEGYRLPGFMKGNGYYKAKDKLKVALSIKTKQSQKLGVTHLSCPEFYSSDALFVPFDSADERERQKEFNMCPLHTAAFQPENC